MPEQKQIKETISFEHNGVELFIKFDYVNNKISFVKPYEQHKSTFQHKNWVFMNRGWEFMDSWITILDAMKEATKFAKKKMKDWHDEQTDIEVELMQVLTYDLNRDGPKKPKPRAKKK